MPSNTLPTGTVSRPRQERTYPLAEDGGSVGSGRSQSTDAPSRGDYERRIAALEAEVAALEGELDRRDRGRQCLIDRYERLIAERDQLLSERPRPSSPDELSLLTALRRRLGL